MTSGDPQHFYGVIIDATFPYKVNKQTYVCSLKVVDPSVHIKSAKGTGDSSDYATVVIYSNKFEDLPIIHRVGDIIRVHRAIVRIYKGQRQFNASVSNNSSWALFSTDKRPPVAGQPEETAPLLLTDSLYSIYIFIYIDLHKKLIFKNKCYYIPYN